MSLAAHPTSGHRVALGVVLAFCALLPFACVPPAPAQDHDGHALHHDDHYRHWMRPHMPSVPCCSARRETPDGTVTGDCAPTQAEPRASAKPELKGQIVWWARRHGDGRWIEIPDDRIVRYANPDPTGRDAQLCEHHEWFGSGIGEVQLIHCFRPPIGGV